MVAAIADCTKKTMRATTAKRREKRRTVTFLILSPEFIAKRPSLEAATHMYYLDCKRGAKAPKSLKLFAIV